MNELHPDDAMKTTPQTAILSFRTWLRQPQSVAALLMLVVLMWPALRPLLVTDPEPALGIASILLLESSQGSTAANFSGDAPYLLQLDARDGSEAAGFTVTLQAEGGNRLLLGQRLQAGGDGWVRVVIPTSLNGNHQVELLWNDAAGTTQRRQFTFAISPRTGP